MQETRTKSNIQASAFYVMIMGQIESATFPSYVDSLYCRYVISYGIDWDVVHGVNSGITQIARRCDIRNQESIIWNFPLDVSFKATNPYGWPRIALGVYGLDALGRDVARGYGSLLIPISAGSYTKHIRTYTPISGSVYQRFLNWIAGTAPEYYDLKFITQGDDRAVTRVENEGAVKIAINVTTKEMKNFGFTL